jgi:hypothetical protein
MQAFERNAFLERAIIHDIDKHFFNHDHIIQLQHYCSRNMFIRKLLHPNSWDDVVYCHPIKYMDGRMFHAIGYLGNTHMIDTFKAQQEKSLVCAQPKEDELDQNEIYGRHGC